MSLTRPPRPTVADERTTLLGFLDYYRATVELKCDGLTPEQLAERTVPPSPLSLLGLVRHLADVERGWFRGFVGEPNGPRYRAEPDGDFVHAVGEADQVAEAFGYWHAEIEHAREVGAKADLDAVFTRKGQTYSLRWVLVHMVEEYARHVGHADFLRERIDGAVGS